MNRKDIDRRKKFILELMGDPVYKPMRLRELSSLLRLSREEKRELFDVLDSLCEDGKITQDNKGRYSRITGKWKKKLQRAQRKRGERQEETRRDTGRGNLYRTSERFWLCGDRRTGRGYFYSGGRHRYCCESG